MSRRIVYIGGYGRSGTTMLDRALALVPGTIGLGECAHLLRAFAGGAVASCSCGEPVARCPLWGEVWNAAVPVVERNGGAEALVRSFAAVEGPARFARDPPAETLRTYRAVWEAIFAALDTLTPGGAVLIDSSKSSRLTAARPVALADDLGLDVRFVHLVRDGRGVLWSVRRGGNRALEGGNARPGAGLRAIGGYTVAHWFASRVARRLSPGACTRVSYETLCTAPDEELAQLADRLGLEWPTDWRTRREPAPHRFAGNRNRLESHLVVRADDGWVIGQSAADRWLWRIAGAPARWLLAGREARDG